MKIMIAGLGSIGRRHLRNLLALGESDLLLFRTNRWVGETNPWVRQPTDTDDELAGIPVETNLQAALAHGPQAVIVSNPTALHLDVAIPAARAGLHLLLEKPISHSMDRLPELQAALDENNSRALVGYHFRFHPGLERLKELLESGAIGRPISVRAHWGEYLPGWHPWEDYRQGYSARSDLGGGVILTLSHPLDYLRWLFGDVQSVWAFSGKLSDLELQVEDTAEIGLRFAAGMLGSLHLDYNQQPPSHHLEVIGTRGTMRWESLSGAVRVFQPGSNQWMEESLPDGFERNTLFLNEMRHFLQVCRGEATPRCNFQDGKLALELALAALESQAQGRLIEM